jgi:fatty acid/phospholipid biosynthesis enzyme
MSWIAGDAMGGDDAPGNIADGALAAARHFDLGSEDGGVPLLGVAGVAVVGHGHSTAKAVRNAVAMAYRFAALRVIERVEQEIAAVAGPRR